MGQMENTSQIAKECAEEMEKKNRKEKITNWMPVGILVFLIVMLSVVADGFLTMYNFRSILSQLSILLVMSMGLTFVILIGGTDLSGEGLGGFVGAVVSLMVLNTKTSLDLGVLAILIAVAAGVAVGIISGLIHVKGMLPSFMVTYAISSVMAGFAVLSYKGTPAMIQDEFFTALAQGSLLVGPLFQGGELDGLGQGIAHLHIVVPGGNEGLVGTLPVVTVAGVQLDLHPAVQLLGHRIPLLLGDLGPDGGLGGRLGTHVEHVCLDNGHEGG